MFRFSLQFCLKHFSSLEEMSEIWSTMYIYLRVKYPLFFSDFNETWILPDRVSKNPQISNFMKIRPVGDELLQANGQTGRLVKANSRFPQATDDGIIRRVPFACWIHKTTNTHSEYVILIAFPWQQEVMLIRLSVTLYVHCLSCWNWIRTQMIMKYNTK